MKHLERAIPADDAGFPFKEDRPVCGWAALQQMRRIDKAERQTYLKPARFGLFVAGPALIFVASKGKRIEAGRRDTTSISIRERHCQFRRLLSRADEPEKS